jgi:hypothetical protein
VYENPPDPADRPGIAPLRQPQDSEGGFPPLMYSALDYSSQLRQPYQSLNRQAELRLAELESRIAQIDPKLVAAEPPVKRTRLDPDSNIEPSFAKGKDAIGISLYGAGFKTGFFGPSSERNAASYYPSVMKLVCSPLHNDFINANARVISFPNSRFLSPSTIYRTLCSLKYAHTSIRSGITRRWQRRFYPIHP